VILTSPLATRNPQRVCLFPFNFLLSKLTNQFESIMQNKANSLKDKTNETLFATKDYQNKPHLRTPPKQTQSNPIPCPQQRKTLFSTIGL